MPRVELVGGFYQDSATQFDTQRCVNMYPVISSDDGGKGRYKLTGVQGVRTLINIELEFSNTGSFCALYTASNGKLYAFYYELIIVNNAGLGKDIYLLTTIEIDINVSGFYTVVGSVFCAINTGTKFIAKIADNGIVMSVVYSGYISTSATSKSFFVNITTNVISQITDADFPDGVLDNYYKDTYFLWATDSRFYVSTSMASNAASCINALDFGTVESNPDKIVCMMGLGNEVAVFGQNTIEYFFDSGNIDFPFERNSGATQEIGTISARSVSKLNNEIYFLGSNKSGYGIIYRMRGYQPERISTHAIEHWIDKVSDISGTIAYTYQTEGNYFYVLTLDEINKTFVYNATTELWHEITLKSNYHAFAFGFNFITSNVSSNEIKISYFADNTYKNNETQVIQRERILRHLSFENKTIQFNSFELDIQKGVGNVDDANPVINLYISRDGGMTYGNAITLSMGEASNYKLRCRASMLGISRNTVFKLISDSPVQHEWIAAYVNYEVMSE